MAVIKTLNSSTPQFGANCFLADGAVIVGDVVCGNDCSIWFNAVMRGDVNKIRLGDRVNVQDGAVIHCTYERTQTQIGNDVSIGHNAVVHGCTIEDNVLIGMGAIVLDGAVVKSNCIIAAGAVVTQNSILESGFIYGGVPAKKIKELDKDQADDSIHRIAAAYLKYASWYKEE